LKINKLQVKNFRNLKRIEYYPSPGLNIFVVNNAQGKTNLLESIFLLAAGNSFRKATDANLVNYEAAGYILSCNYNISGRSLEASLQYQLNSSKIAMINT
jgi:DNA replication and repair protein RecF